MMKKTALLLLVFALLFAVTPAHAQGQRPPKIVASTLPVSKDIKTAVLALIEETPPTASPFYAITAVSLYKGGYAVSVAALSASKNESQGWHLGDGEFEWLGSFYVTEDTQKKYKAEYLSNNMPSLLKRAAPNIAGGGAGIALPISSGTCAIYSPVGVTAAGYGSYGSGLYAIDLITGRDIGTNAAPPQAYASSGGTEEIDWVCFSEEVVMVKTQNTLTSDVFIYGNLEPGNTAHYVGHQFIPNSMIGELVNGPFDGSDGVVNCGSSGQSETRATLRWGFEPAGGYFQAENYIINISSDQIDRDGTTINPGDAICSGSGWTGGDWGGSPSGRVQAGVANFFDLFVVGIANMVNTAINNTLPAHNSNMSDFVLVAANAAKVIFKIAFVMFKGNINLAPVMAVAAFWLAVFAIWGAIRLVLLVFQFVRLVLLR